MSSRARRSPPTRASTGRSIKLPSAQREWNRLTPAERAAARRQAAAAEAEARSGPTGGSAEEVGRWTQAPFDPWATNPADHWVRQPSMEAGRWYPTQALLADGRTAIFGGYNEDPPGDEKSDHLEIFTAATDPAGVRAVERHPEADQDGTLYPHMFTLPDGDVLTTGPYPDDNYRLDVSRLIPTWSGVDHFVDGRPRIGGTGVIVPKGPQGWSDVMLMGGYGYASSEGEAEATSTSEALDAGDPDARWQVAPGMNEVRSHHNTIQLPDRSMVTVGGGVGLNDEEGNFRIDPEGAQRQIELFNPKTDTWRLGAAQQEDRGYHSTALLLPDGRVWSAGDDEHPNQIDGSPSDDDTGEIYSPPICSRASARRSAAHRSGSTGNSAFA